MVKKQFLNWLSILLAAALLTACGGGGDSAPPPPPANNSNWDHMAWDQDNWTS